MHWGNMFMSFPNVSENYIWREVELFKEKEKHDSTKYVEKCVWQIKKIYLKVCHT